MLNTLKLRGRIFLGFSISTFLAIISSGIFYGISQQISEIFKEVERSQQVLLETDEMALRTSMMARQVQDYLLNKNDDSTIEFQKQKKLYDRAVQQTDILIQNSQQRETFKNMLQQGENFDKLSRETFRLVDRGQQKEAVNRYLINSQDMVGKIDKLNEEFNNKEKAILSSYTESANKALYFGVLMAVASAALSLTLGTLAGYLISSTVAKTISEIVNAIASSSAEISATTEQQERTATQQAASVNQTTSTMHELGASARTSTEQAESSAASARQVLTLAESSTASARQVLTLAESSATSARQVLTLAESSATSARQVLTLAESSAAGARQVLKEAEGGTKIVERTLDEMSNLKEKVGEIAEQIVRLREQTGQIGNITNIVSELANQTNMLALNAAVEAVRAGENGKGFGVIATEIRKLADQSKQSAEKINTLIVGIQGAIETTVMVTDSGRNTASSAIALSRQTTVAFTSVTEAINEIVLKSSIAVFEAIDRVVLNASLEVARAIEDEVLKASVGVAISMEEVVLNNQIASLKAIDNIVISSQQISLTAKQQAIAIEQVVEAMNALNRGAVETASGITQTKVGIHKLNEAAQNLKAIV